jgi:spore coat polysaccharide biosynthesis protein SpsF
MKIAILVTARLKSTRLPLKAVKPIKDKPLICHLLARLKLATLPTDIIICTSHYEQDDPLIGIAMEEGVKFYRGHPDDVLLRLTNAAAEHDVDVVVSCTADNPFVDPHHIDKLIEFHLENNYDYSRVDGLPFGTFSYVLSYPAMGKACEIKDAVDTEVWGGYFTQTGLFRCGVLEIVDKRYRRPELRLTVDTPEDFQLVTEIFDHLYIPGQVFGLREIIELLDAVPKLQEINQKVVQKPGKPIRLR